MPRNVRNFWIDANIDGRQETLSGGPQGKNGGFTLTVKMRDNGDIKTVLTVQGDANTAKTDGDLDLWVTLYGGVREEVLMEHITTRR